MSENNGDVKGVGRKSIEVHLKGLFQERLPRCLYSRKCRKGFYSETPDRCLKSPFVVSPLSANHGAHHTLFAAILCGLSPNGSERVETIHRYKISDFYAYTSLSKAKQATAPAV